jgi:hypothetical protein
MSTDKVIVLADKVIDILESRTIFCSQIYGWLHLCLEPRQFMSGFQWIVDCLRVEPAYLFYNGPRENIIECKISQREEHLKNLWDPEQPDPGRHLFQIFLQGVLNLLELRLIKISSLLY